MKKIKSGKILLKEIKHIENSRLRGLDDVGDLMQDIEQRGLLQPVAIREVDNALIFGNRRVTAYEKLGYVDIECDFYGEISDDDLLIINLAENLKRKSIGSIEVGRICKILQDKGMTSSEISVKLGISKGRVNSSVSSYNVTLNTPFEKLVMFGEKGSHTKGIPETLIWDIQNSLTRARRLSKQDWEHLLRALETKELTKEKITQLRKIILSNPIISIPDALAVLKKCKVAHIWLHMNLKILNRSMIEEKCGTEVELIRKIIRDYNKKLLF